MDRPVGIALPKFVDQIVNRVQDRLQRILVAHQYEPGGERPSALAAERIEGFVHHLTRIRFPVSGTDNGLTNAGRHGFADRPGKLDLKARCRAEMMQDVGVRTADAIRDGFQRNSLRPRLEQQLARGGDCGGPTFVRAKPPA